MLVSARLCSAFLGNSLVSIGSNELKGDELVIPNQTVSGVEACILRMKTRGRVWQLLVRRLEALLRLVADLW
jgi:hypothetical protein